MECGSPPPTADESCRKRGMPERDKREIFGATQKKGLEEERISSQKRSGEGEDFFTNEGLEKEKEERISSPSKSPSALDLVLIHHLLLRMIASWGDCLA